ncbi:hypothetical protein UFOVP979_12 [uncultured Caudovirales phage]|uniref:Uncharacterized protein n=1 Tax=uncultured Caudovirales phage TaxID=2100421 RepID=A0A6J5SR76_9CAUD|nr:hypothetical protein UFOVP979_12 [uncultured Caudovirales phage]CAB4217007.1 hypothetical protein UFOVP1503_3 [uncultured Caudovirales phage]CAB5225728.1 hypothetical protein UFOVP1505_2 [uncultured Caudovirales phage]
MAGVAVAGSGNYELFVDTGFLQNAFILDDAVAGVLDNTQYVLDGTTNFAAILDGCVNVRVKRGRQDIGDQFGAGTMSFTLSDTSGIFNPFDEQSPYWDSTTQQPGLAPMRKVELVRYDSLNVPQFIFRGYVINYNYDFVLGGIDLVTVFCGDDLYLLSQTVLDEFNVSEQLTSERLTAVLDLPEVAFPALARNISTGTQTLGGAAAFTVDQGTNALAYCIQINEAEQGRLFMSNAGLLNFQPRIGNTLSGSVADFHDDGTNLPYNELGISFEADQVVNRAVVQILGSNNPQVADDAASQATYFIQTTSITNSLLHSDAAAEALAIYLLDGEPQARYTSVGTAFNMLTNPQREALAALDIGNTITVEKTFTSGAGTTELAQELAIEGIEHTLEIRTGHKIMLFTSPTTIVYELLLDDALYGIIDADNVLG